jgi:hypothetical protein
MFGIEIGKYECRKDERKRRIQNSLSVEPRAEPENFIEVFLIFWKYAFGQKAVKQDDSIDCEQQKDHHIIC